MYTKEISDNIKETLNLLIDINKYNVHVLGKEYAEKYYNLKNKVLNFAEENGYIKSKKYIRQEFSRYKIYEEAPNYYSSDYDQITYPISRSFSSEQKAIEYFNKLYQEIKFSLRRNEIITRDSEKMFTITRLDFSTPRPLYDHNEYHIYYISESSKVRSILSEFKIQINNEEHTIHHLDYSCTESKFGKSYKNIDEESFERLWASMDKDTPQINFSLSEGKQIPKNQDELEYKITELENLISFLIEAQIGR